MLKLATVPLKKLIHHLNRRQTRLLPRLSTSKKIIIILLVVFLSSQITRLVKAQGFENYIEAIENPSQESWVLSSLDSTVTGTLHMLIDIGNLPSQFANKDQSWVPGGALGTTNQLIASLYRPQASGLEYIAQSVDTFLGKPAYAQSNDGLRSLQPLIPIWRGFRNLVYILTSLIFVAVGVLVMLRVKTSPQTIVTIQNSIPKIISTLILVTFSYAIAGLLIDLMNVIQGIFIALLFTVQGKSLDQSLFQQSFTENITDLGVKEFSFASLSHPNLSSVYNLSFRLLPLNTLLLLGGLVGAVVGIFAGVGSGTFLATFGFMTMTGIVIVLLVLVIMVLIWQLQFFFGLIKNYVSVIFKVVLAPLEIGAGAIPGLKVGFGSWLLQIVANLAVFPISLGFMVMANLIIEGVQNGIGQKNPLWMPSIMNPSGNLVEWFASVSGGLPAAAIGLSAIFLISKLPKTIPEAIFQIKQSAWDKAGADTIAPFSKFGKFAATSVFNTQGGALLQNYGDKITNLKKTKAGKYLDDHIKIGKKGATQAKLTTHLGTKFKETGQNIKDGKIKI